MPAFRLHLMRVPTKPASGNLLAPARPVQRNLLKTRLCRHSHGRPHSRRPCQGTGSSGESGINFPNHRPENSERGTGDAWVAEGMVAAKHTPRVPSNRRDRCQTAVARLLPPEQDLAKQMAACTEQVSDFYTLTFDPPLAAPGYRGQITVDPSDGAILRVEIEVDLPGFVPANRSGSV
jgi:hypothetical protein